MFCLLKIPDKVENSIEGFYTWMSLSQGRNIFPNTGVIETSHAKISNSFCYSFHYSSREQYNRYGFFSVVSSGD